MDLQFGGVHLSGGFTVLTYMPIKVKKNVIGIVTN